MNPRQCIIYLLGCWIGVGSAAFAQRAPLKIIPANNVWNGGGIQDIKKVLTSAADELWKHAYDEKLHPIIVNNGDGGPIVFYQRGREGQYRVKLNTGKTYWSQYAFQFSHEFCHILCRYKEADQTNLWFEESLCETASLFSLRAMAKTWEHRPPYSNWKNYRHSLRNYAQDRIDKHRLPEGKRWLDWYHENQELLRSHPTDRPKNTTVAIQLLPLFEKNPRAWAAVSFINHGRTKDPQDFKTYLANWQQHCPEEHREVITAIQALFGLGG